MAKYDVLLSPVQVTPTFTLKNRMVKAPQSTWLWNEDGTADGSRAIDMYESMAKGGAAGLIIAAILWEPAGAGIYLSAFDDKFIPGMLEFNERIHKYRCKTIAQLHHMGPSAWGTPDGGPPIAPSTLSENEIPTPPPFGRATRGLSVEEIHEKQRLMIEAAVRLQKGGFDGVEVHAAHGYFLNSFLSPIWNKRDDEYGFQNVENRTRIIRETFAGIREACGPDFLIGTRINGQEFSPTHQGITMEQSVENAKALEAAGAQYMSVSGYGYGPLSFRYCPDYFPYPEPEPHMVPYMDRYYGRGLWNEPTKNIKKAVKIPVITAGRMNEDLAETILRDGDADIIALGRSLWADPEFANKVKEGRCNEIVRCTRCASCEDPVTQPRICRVNPSLGREKELAIIPAEKKKKVMVIGGGPAGMEAARVASLRGHEVTIYDKNSELGGRIKLASMIKGSKIEDVMPIYDYLTSQIEKSNVKVKLKSEVTPELVRKEKPDAIIVATSSPYFIPDIPGIDRKKVFTIPGMAKLASVPMKMFGPEKLSSMTEKFFPVGKKIVILGGQIEGIQCAVFMAKRNKEIVVIEESDVIGTGIPLKYHERILPWFDQKGVKIIKNTKCTSVEKNGVNVIHTDGTSEFIACNSVMVMMPEYQDTTLYDALKPLVPEIYNAGSVVGAENGLLKHALLDGRSVGCSV